MIINQLRNRRKTREYLLMFFYSREIENFKFDDIYPHLQDYFEEVDHLMYEDGYALIQEHITDVFNSVKVTKLENEDKIGFTIPGMNKEFSMSFGEMDEENIKDGFLALSYKISESLIKRTDKTSDLKADVSNFDFFKKYFEMYEKNLENIDEVIERKLQNWDLSRVSIVDKIIIRMGVVEFTYFPEIPEKVIINEAIELGKRFSSEKSNVFINGILNKFKDELRETIKK